MTQQFNGLANAARLINAALFTDRQVHRQMQEGIVPRRICVLHGCQSSLHIRQFGVVFRMLINPLTRQNFNGLQGPARPGFGISTAKKAPDIGLRRLYQHG